MNLFRHETRQKSERNRRFYAACEVVYTLVDFLAAMLFLVGSILFFFASFETIAIWFFVVGSLFFAAKPTIKLGREIKMLRQGDFDELADNENS